MDEARSIADLKRLVQRFCEERDWDQFHGPKDLAIGIVTEAAEVLEQFRFLADGEVMHRLDDPRSRASIEAEIADVLFFVLRFAQRFTIDLDDALRRKLETNAVRYPVEKARGRNLKYTEL